MTEEEALDRVDEIGTAFANDLNDGGSSVLYEGVRTYYTQSGELVLVYNATLEGDEKVSFMWRMELVEE